MLHSRLLRYLDEVVRAGSIRKAATRLNVASSAINRQILALEETIGTPIFERMPRRLRLTASGEILIAHVRETLKEHQRVQARIEALRGLKRGEVTIATTGGLAGGPLPAFVSRLLDEHPRVHIRLKILPVDQIANAVLTGEADLALGYNLATSHGLRVAASHEVILGAVVAPSHPLTRRRSLWLSDCLAYPLVTGDASMTLRPLVELAFARANVTLNPTIETNSIELMKEVARSGSAVTFLNPIDIVLELTRGELIYLPFQDAPATALRLAVRARGTLDTFPSFVLEELRKALPKWADATR